MPDERARQEREAGIGSAQIGHESRRDRHAISLARKRGEGKRRGPRYSAASATGPVGAKIGRSRLLRQRPGVTPVIRLKARLKAASNS